MLTSVKVNILVDIEPLVSQKVKNNISTIINNNFNIKMLNSNSNV